MTDKKTKLIVGKFYKNEFGDNVQYIGKTDFVSAYPHVFMTETKALYATDENGYYIKGQEGMGENIVLKSQEGE